MIHILCSVRTAAGINLLCGAYNIIYINWNLMKFHEVFGKIYYFSNYMQTLIIGIPISTHKLIYY